MSLRLLGRTGRSSSGSPSSSDAIHRRFPCNAEVQEAADALMTSEYMRDRPKSARQAVPSPRMRTLGYTDDRVDLKLSGIYKLTPFKSP